MKILNVQQSSEAWLQARAGLCTASMFSVARSKVGALTEQQARYVKSLLSGKTEKEARSDAGYKSAPRSASIEKALDLKTTDIGEFSEAAKNYAFKVAVERISGEPLDEGFETWAMKRGRELEPDARMEHELQTGLLVEECGLITDDTGFFGASADGLIGEDEGAEYKCFINAEKMRAIIFEQDIGEVMDQVQGGLWLSGRQRWRFCLYAPALEAVGKQLTEIVFERDDAYIKAMEADLEEFRKLVNDYEATLRSEMLDRKAA